MTYKEIRSPTTDKLLFRYDPERHMVEIQHRGVKTEIDLTSYSKKEKDNDTIDITKEEPT